MNTSQLEQRAREINSEDKERDALYMRYLNAYAATPFGEKPQPAATVSMAIAQAMGVYHGMNLKESPPRGIREFWDLFQQKLGKGEPASKETAP